MARRLMYMNSLMTASQRTPASRDGEKTKEEKLVWLDYALCAMFPALEKKKKNVCQPWVSPGVSSMKLRHFSS